MKARTEAPGPCPFCGGPGQVKAIPKPFRHGWVGCPECRVFITWNQSEAASVAVWNRRPGK